REHEVRIFSDRNLFKRTVSEKPLMRHKTVDTYPTFFLRGFAVGHRLRARQAIQGMIQAYLGWQKVGGSEPVYERFFGRSRTHLPDIQSGRIIGDFCDREASPRPLLRRESRSLRPPLLREQSPV